MKVFTTNDFKGHWPVGSAAVITAESEEQARRLLWEQISYFSDEKFTLEELPLDVAVAYVLTDGNY